jgi:hypothetical protein
MGAGFRNWGRLFVTNLVAGLFIFLGCIAFVVPGVLLSIRYSLIDPVVVFERSPAPRQRSTELTVGRRWQIFLAYGLFYGLFLAGSFALGYVIGLFQDEMEWLDHLWVNVLTSCVLDVVGSLITILLVLFYLDARALQPAPAVDPFEGFNLGSKLSEAS